MGYDLKATEDTEGVITVHDHQTGHDIAVFYFPVKKGQTISYEIHQEKGDFEER